MRQLWLTYECPPHPDAVMHPVDSDEAEFVIGILSSPYDRRLHLTAQLDAYLTSQSAKPFLERQPVPCRTPGGVFRLVPWRLAKWLRHALPSADSVLSETITRIEQWRSAPKPTAPPSQFDQSHVR